MQERGAGGGGDEYPGEDMEWPGALFVILSPQAMNKMFLHLCATLHDKMPSLYDHVMVIVMVMDQSDSTISSHPPPLSRRRRCRPAATQLVVRLCDR